MKLKSINPFNYKIIGEVEVSTEREIAEKVGNARAKTAYWSGFTLSERVAMLRGILSEFENRKEEIALLESREIGKPITAARGDFNDALTFANWYLDNAERCLAPETTVDNENEIHRVYREPLGVAAVIIPWNYPFLMFIWTVFPNLLAGNTVVLKHSEECPLVGKLIEEVMTRYMPKGVFAEVYGNGRVGQQLVNQDIDLITFTGSGKTGQRLYQIAAKNFIRIVMELGGSAPGIVFEDADIDSVVQSVCSYRLANAGQYCDGLKRLLVHEKVFNIVVAKTAKAFRAIWVGNPEDPVTEMGPLAAKRQLDLLIQQVDDADDKGARIVEGGYSLEREWGGAFHEPTLITNVGSNMKVWQEEVFGPVLPVMSFNTEEEAIALANDTKYGLGGYIYTTNQERAERVARALKTGMVGINNTNYTRPENPFGGYKASGIGREHGKWGFHDLTQVKVVARNK